MKRICGAAVLGFSLLWMAALAVLLVGTFGLFGQERDPLSGVYLVILGVPWTALIDLAPEPLWPWLSATVPALNLALLALICRVLGRASEKN